MSFIYEELSLGRLLAHFRDRRDMTVKAVQMGLPGGPDQWGQSFLSNLENNKTSRPSPELLQELAGALLIEPDEVEYSWLLRAADAFPEEAELATRDMLLQDVVDQFARCPAYAVDYRSGLRAYNRRFAELFAPVEPADGDVAALTRGTSIFSYLFSRKYRFWSSLHLADRDAVGQYFLRRFWRATRPLLQPRWEPNVTGEPAWLTQMVETVYATLPPLDRDTFATLNELTRKFALENLAKQLSLSTHGHIVDSLFCHIGERRYEIAPRPLDDARFHVIVLSPE